MIWRLHFSAGLWHISPLAKELSRFEADVSQLEFDAWELQSDVSELEGGHLRVRIGHGVVVDRLGNPANVHRQNCRCQHDPWAHSHAG